MRRRHALLRAVGAAVTALLVSAPWLWTEIAAAGHEHDVAHAPVADVVIVLGTEVAADRQHPGDRLTGRLRTAAQLVHTGRARVVLVSGDGGGASGNEPAVMSTYLTDLGVDQRQVVSDPFGLDTYDSCIRARDVYGIKSALIVTQAYHLSRAVTLCRHVGLAAEGVTADCAGCSSTLLAEKAVRDFFACGKAAWDAIRNRPPAVRSAADPSVREALSAT
jgi:vancomycin permeability regulator SanA